MSDQNQQAVPTSPTRPVEAATRAAADNVVGFRHFLSKSNTIALAIGIIIGKAATSLVMFVAYQLARIFAKDLVAPK